MIVSVQWPSVLKLDGIDELVYFADVSMWHRGATSLGVGASDRLIDSQGMTFRAQPDGLLQDGNMSLQAFEALVRAHLVAMQQCCVYKLTLASYEEGLDLVRDSGEYE